MVTSIVIHDAEHCFICGAPYPEEHHIYFDPYRKWADKYHLTVPLCAEHHRGNKGPHHCRDINIAFKKLGKQAYEAQIGSREEFVHIFGQSWL